MTVDRRFVLASASPRRRQLLAGLGLDFEVRPTAVNERARPEETPAALVQRLAVDKATAAARRGDLVLGSDTVVVLDGAILGKPADAAGAREMLARLAGRIHAVYTGLAVIDGDLDRTATAVESTTVRFAAMTMEEIGWYVGTGEPLDKAGAYAVQGLGGLFVDEIEGSYSNVVGLPLAVVRRLVAELGFDLRQFMSDDAPGAATDAALDTPLARE